MPINPFEEVLRKLGKPDNATIIGSDTADLFAARAPQWLTNFWKTEGIGSYRDGYFWLCLPNELDSTLHEVLASFPDLEPRDFSIFGYTSDSTLYALDRFGKLYWIFMNLSYIITFDTNEENLEVNKRGRFPRLLAAIKWIDDDLSLHIKATAKLGPLKKGEVYGFFPALQLGGATDVANLRKARALEHWSFIAQLQPFQFRDDSSKPSEG